MCEVDVSSDPVGLVEQMLRFLYTKDYEVVLPDPESEAANKSHDANRNLADIEHILKQKYHVAMHILGNKYMIKGLEEHATNKFRSNLPAHWRDDYWEIVGEIYNDTLETSSLRVTILDWWFVNSNILLRNQEFKLELERYPNVESILLRRHVTKIHTQIDGLIKLPSEISQLSTEISQLSTQLQKSEGSWESFGHDVDKKLLHEFNLLNQCRGCKADFRFQFYRGKYSCSNPKRDRLDLGIACRTCRTQLN